MNRAVQESWNNIKAMIADRGIKPCERMNTGDCPYGMGSFPDKNELPMCHDVAILFNCWRCIYNVFRELDSTEIPAEVLTMEVYH